MTDSNRTQITYIKELTWGVTPGTPQMQALRVTGESLNTNIQNVVSAEIVPDRQVSDLIQTSKEASGDINFELSYGSFDDLLAGALQASTTWTAATLTGTDIAADATGLTSSGASNFVTAGFVVGQIIKVAGFTGNTANNTYYRVTSVTSNDLNLSPAPAAVDAAGESVTVSTSYIRNGTTESSFSIEKGFTDAAEFFAYVGMMVSKMSLNVKSQQIMTGSFSFMGKNGTLSGTSLDSTPTAANTNAVYNAVGNVASIKENNTAVTTPNFVQSLSFELNNNVRSNFAIGSDTPVNMGSGKCDVTGNIKTYFGDSALMDKFIAGTKTSLDFRVADAAGNTYVFDLPEVKFESAKVEAQGQDQEVFADMGYRAIKDATYGFTIQIAKFPA